MPKTILHAPRKIWQTPVLFFSYQTPRAPVHVRRCRMTQWQGFFEHQRNP